MLLFFFTVYCISIPPFFFPQSFALFLFRVGTSAAELTAWETYLHRLLTFFPYIHFFPDIHNLRSMCLKATNEEARKPPGPAWKNKDESKQPEEHQHRGVSTQLERVIKSGLIQVFSRAVGHEGPCRLRNTGESLLPISAGSFCICLQLLII